MIAEIILKFEDDWIFGAIACLFAAGIAATVAYWMTTKLLELIFGKSR